MRPHGTFLSLSPKHPNHNHVFRWTIMRLRCTFVSLKLHALRATHLKGRVPRLVAKRSRGALRDAVQAWLGYTCEVPVTPRAFSVAFSAVPPGASLTKARISDKRAHL